MGENNTPLAHGTVFYLFKWKIITEAKSACMFLEVTLMSRKFLYHSD